MGGQHRRGCWLPSATYFLLVQKVGKNTLKEENPFDWVSSLKNLSFLNDQRGSKKVRKAFLHTAPKDAGSEAPLETRSFGAVRVGGVCEAVRRSGTAALRWLFTGHGISSLVRCVGA